MLLLLMNVVLSAVIIPPISPEHNSLSFNMSATHEATTVINVQHVNVCACVATYNYCLYFTFIFQCLCLSCQV